MKNNTGLVFGVGMLLLASFFFFACTKADDKVIASGYTEENNAQNNLDSVLAGILETWEVVTGTDSSRKQGTGANEDKFWYEVEFTSTAKQLYAYDAGGEDSASFVVSLYDKEKGLRLDMSTPEKTVSFTQVLSRDSLKAVAENRIDNTYYSADAASLCRSDSVDFVNDCVAASGSMVDQFMDGVCSELHLVCVKRFTPEMIADDYLIATAQMLKKKYEEEIGLPGMDFFVDARDGHIYRSVEIAGTVWMAENLNYAYRQPTSLWDSSSFCYDNDEANCDKYGRMYIWSAVMDSVGLFSDDGKGCGFGSACNPPRNVRGVCPEGWRVPNYDEWTRLIDSVGGIGTAGLHLKDVEHGGDDIFGFSAQPSGFHIEYEGAVFRQKDTAGVFWTVTEKNGNESYVYRFFDSYDYVGQDMMSGYGSAPVRCVKGEAERVMYGAFDPLLVEKGSMTDPRDGQVYGTVTIDGQTWMASNLAYDLGEGSLCFNNDPANCEKYGRMYTFYAVRETPACPAGWHLPSKDEFDDFQLNTGRGFADKKSVTGWADEAGNGKDTYGFGLLPGGVGRYNKADSSMNFAGVGESAYLWTSTTTYSTFSADSMAYSYSTEAEPPGVWTSLVFAQYGYVRCIMD